MTIPVEDLQYVTSLEEIWWGTVLVAVTLAVHGIRLTLHLPQPRRRDGQWGAIESRLLTEPCDRFLSTALMTCRS